MEIKIRSQLPDFCANAKFCAKEHAYWGEKFNFRRARKVKFNATSA